MFALMEASRLSKLIGVIGKQKVRINELIQNAAVQCVAQSIEFRNSTPAANLFEAVGTGTRRDALVAYFEKYGNLKWDKDAAKVTFFDKAKELNEQPLALTPDYANVLLSNHWTAAKKEAAPKSMFDTQEMVANLIDTLRRKAAKGLEVKHAKLLSEVEQTYVRYMAKLADEMYEGM